MMSSDSEDEIDEIDENPHQDRNDEEMIEPIVNVNNEEDLNNVDELPEDGQIHPAGLIARLFERLIAEVPAMINVNYDNVVDSDDDEDEHIGGNEWDNDPPAEHNIRRDELREDAESEPDVEASPFDPQLPIRHSYLGEGMEELQGRTIWDDEDGTLSAEVPIVVMGLHLVPGQILPLTIFHSVFQNAIRRLVNNDRMFGVVHNEHVIERTSVSRGTLGTLAEVYEFQEESDDNALQRPLMSNYFAIKARGRYRFNVLEIRRQADGNLMGKIKIRPEVRLPFFPQNLSFPGTARYHWSKDAPVLLENACSDIDLVTSENREDHDGTPAGLGNRRMSQISITGNERKPTFEENATDSINRRLQIKHEKTLTSRFSVYTAWPSFVYDQYNEKYLVEKVYVKLRELRGLVESTSSIPSDATELSFWIAQNLTMEDSKRMKILSMDSPIERLRFELDVLDRVSKVISCRRCEATIALRSDLFSMSVGGPAGTYVNPGGFIHETLTVYKSHGLQTDGLSSTEASWFPGYAWTIVKCRRCTHHIGWRFHAVGGRLKPRKFYGITRRAINFKYEMGNDSIDELAPPAAQNNQRPVIDLVDIDDEEYVTGDPY